MEMKNSTREGVEPRLTPDAREKELLRFAADIRIQTILTLMHAGFGHIGGTMSIADVLAVLYGEAMNIDPKRPRMDERDWLVLSKGHCGPALYATLALKGFFPLEELKTLNRPGTRLPSHCDRLRTIGIDMSTGSLGQGASAAMGIALGHRMKGHENRTFLIMGDGELQEGQVWEAAQFAAHQGLNNLTAFVDANQKQLDGKVLDICRPFETEEKFKAFGWHVQSIRGYDIREIRHAIDVARQYRQGPSVILLNTVKGIGCNFAEEAPFNHYMTITKEMADRAIEEIERRLGLELEGGAPYVPALS